MSKPINNLNISLIEMINNAGLSELEVIELLNTELIDYVTNESISSYQKSTDNNLNTTDKTVVGAINELFQDANSGKTLIAGAIGDSSITSNSTFEAMINKIQEIKNEKDSYAEILNGAGGTGSAEDIAELSSFMSNNGFSITGNETLEELLQILRNSGSAICTGIASVECGYNHAMLLRHDGRLLGFGYNNYGQLGTGDNNNATIPTLITTISDVKQVSCGEYHTIALKNDGTVWVTGRNNYGQLGLGNTTDKNIWTQVTVTGTVTQVECGGCFTYYVNSSGYMYSTGYNSDGQLGLGNTTNKTSFTRISTNGTSVASVSCGDSHVLMRKTNGSLYACGNNYYGQLGLGTSTETYKTFTSVTTNIVAADIIHYHAGDSVSFVVQKDEEWESCSYACGWDMPAGTYSTDYNVFTKTSSCNYTASVVSGFGFSIMIGTENSSKPYMVMGAGSNSRGQLGYNYGVYSQPEVFYVSNVSGGKQASCAEDFSLLVKRDGSVWLTGQHIGGMYTEWTKIY